MTDAANPDAITNNDGYLNIFSGVGTKRDPLSMTRITGDPLLDQGTLESLFSGDGLARRIVEMPADEMTRSWFRIEGEGGEAVSDHLETINARGAFVNSAVWARLYGGAVAVILLEDGLTLAEPVDDARIRRVIGIKVFDRYRVTLSHGDELSADPIRALDGIPAIINVKPPRGGGAMRVHESRCVFIPGVRLPEMARAANGGWDASVLQGAVTPLLRYNTGLNNATALMRDFVQSVLSVKGLTQMLASGRESVVRDRLALLDLSRSLLNTMIIDADGEAYSKSSSSVAGIPDLIDRFIEHLSSVTGIPVNKLVGRSAAGLNATGAAETRNWYDALSAEQHRVLSPLAERVVGLIYASMGGAPDAWSIRWNSLYAPTDADVATMRKTVAETDKIYLDTGVLSAEDVAVSRFGGGDWSMATTLSEPDAGQFDNPDGGVGPEA